MLYHRIKDDHQNYWKEKKMKSEGKIVMKNQKDIASCSDKILMWNYLGKTFSLLGLGARIILSIEFNSFTF